MKYMKLYEEYNINLNDIKFSYRDAIGRYKIPSEGKSIYCIYKYKGIDLEVAHVKYFIFKEMPLTNEFRGIYNSEIYLEYIETDEEYRRNGLANMLLKELIRIAKKDGIDIISLKYDMFNKDPEWLKHQYEKVGFKLLSGNKMVLILKEKDNLPIV